MSNTREINKLYSELSRYNTNHLLHFIITMFTGLWLIVWIIVADDNAVMRARIRNKIGKLQDANYKPERTSRLVSILLVLLILLIIVAAIGSQP
jgi:hypothetical protein